MSVSRSAFLALTLACLAFAAFADARSVLQNYDSDAESTSGCEAPPDGDWIVRHAFSVGPGNERIEEQSRSIVSLRRVLDNLYQGVYRFVRKFLLNAFYRVRWRCVVDS